MELLKIDGLPALVEIIRELLATTIGSIVLALFVFSYLLIKVPNIPLIQYLFRWKASKLKWLKDHSISTSDELFCKSVIEDIHDAMIFQQVTGIYAEKKWRKGLVELHDQIGVSWVVMKRARRFMVMKEDGTIFLRDFRFSDKLDSWFNSIMTWVFLVMAVVVLITAFVFKPTFSVISTAIPVMFLLFGCAVGAASQNFPKHAAKLVKERLAMFH